MSNVESTERKHSSIVVNGWFGKIIALFVVALLSTIVARTWEVPSTLADLNTNVQVIAEQVKGNREDIKRNERLIDQWYRTGPGQR